VRQTGQAVPDGAVALPPPALHALRTAALLGEDGATRVRDAGYDAGRALYDGFTAWCAARTGSGVADPAGVPLEAFGSALGDWARAHGWGALAFEAGDGADTGGLPVLRATHWFEVEPPGTPATPHPSCHFTTGLLAGFLGRLAGRPLAVLEVACGPSGDPACRFVVGGPPALARLYAARYGK
jgi:hypothetical protein